jgi:hypothetical protein
MKLTQFLFIALFLFSSCNKSSESKQENIAQESTQDLRRTAPASAKKISSTNDMEGDEAIEEESQSLLELPSLGKPSNPISDLSKERLLEYKIHLSFRTKNLLVSRDKLIEITEKTSILKSTNISVSEFNESMNAEIFTPVDKLYETLLLFNALGDLTNEAIQTVDWTEHNERQKIKMRREEDRSSRRSKATSAGSAANWTWKDREELLERSEDNMDEAKMEAWKVKDNVRWAKISIGLSGRETPMRIKFPNFRNAFVSSINFLLEAIYSLVWFIPIGLIGFGIYKIFRWYRNRY